MLVGGYSRKELVMKILFVIFCTLSVPFLVRPAAIGYWYTGKRGGRSFKIPFRYWAIPILLLMGMVITGLVIQACGGYE